MINKIIASMFFVLCLVSISLALMGVEHVEIGRPFLVLMKTTSKELEDFAVSIPDIPFIPDIEEVGGGWAVLKVLVTFINQIVNLLNFIIMVINTIIQLIEFVFILLKNIIIFRDTLVSQSV